MLSLLKKKSEAAAAPAVPAWHPNFRNYEKLPDIKVVRTAFFVNVAAITIALAAAIFFGLKEWQLHVLRGQIAVRQGQIDRDKKGSDQAIALFKKFQAEEAKVAEVDAFIKSKPVLSEILVRLGETLPPNIALDSVDLRETGLMIRFSIRGSAEAATGYATSYREQLAADKEMAARFDDVQFTSTPSKNPTTGRVTVEIFMHLKGAKK
jgi:hypothetical protein